jgi:hypothetical protein
MTLKVLLKASMSARRCDLVSQPLPPKKWTSWKWL